MKHVRTAVTIAVVAGLLMPVGSTAAPTPAHRPVDISAHDVTIDYNPKNGVLQGSAVITARAMSTLQDLTFHLDGPKAGAVTIDGVAATSFTQSGDALAVTPAQPVARGARFRVRVDYAGEPGAGWLRTESGGATAFQGASSAWFPVGDDQDKAEFSLTATEPEGWHVVSVGREEQAPNAVRWFERDIAPAHIAVSVDRFTVERSKLADGTPVVNAYAPGIREKTKPLADQLPQIMDFLISRYGTYPFDAAGNVFVHVNNDGPGTAPQTRPVYLGARSEFMDLLQVVHEQAHQWYGVSVAGSLPEDACLSECFASHSTWMWEEAKNGVDLDTRYLTIVNEKKTDAAFWRLPLYQEGKRPGLQLYDRGPLALHALHRQIGDRSFDSLLVQWAQRNRHSFASWPQFEQLARQISGQDLTGFFGAWFRGTAVPADEYLWLGR